LLFYRDHIGITIGSVKMTR